MKEQTRKLLEDFEQKLKHHEYELTCGLASETKKTEKALNKARSALVAHIEHLEETSIG